MANKIFYIIVAPQGQERSMIDGAKYLIDLLSQLSKVDDIFNEFTFSSEKIKEVINIKNIGGDKATTVLAELFLKINKLYIKKVSVTNPNPTVDYSWDLGFRFLLKFYENGQQRFAMSGNVSTPLFPEICIQYFYSKHVYSLNWFTNIFKCLIENTNSYFGSIRFFGHPLLSKELENIKSTYHIGWVTFFSNANPVQIPADLEGMEYEHTDKGLYLILPHDGFTDDETGLYPDQITKLISVMVEIKKRVPNYSNI